MCDKTTSHTNIVVVIITLNPHESLWPEPLSISQLGSRSVSTYSTAGAQYNLVWPLLISLFKRLILLYSINNNISARRDCVCCINNDYVHLQMPKVVKDWGVMETKVVTQVRGERGDEKVHLGRGLHGFIYFFNASKLAKNRQLIPLHCHLQMSMQMEYWFFASFFRL